MWGRPGGLWRSFSGSRTKLNLILEAEIIEQRFLPGLLTHHRGRPPRLHPARRLGERLWLSRDHVFASYISDLPVASPSGENATKTHSLCSRASRQSLRGT